MLKVALFGPPQTGKSTIFSALTAGHSQAVKSHSGHLEIHRGIVKVPDPGLVKLALFYQPKKITPVEIEYFDLVGTLEQEKVKEGEKTAILREADQLALVCETFSSGGGEKALEQAGKEVGKSLEDLIILDLLGVEKRLQKLEKEHSRGQTIPNRLEQELLARCKDVLESQKPASQVRCSLEEEKMLAGFGLLTRKPILIIVNIDEADLPKRTQIEDGLKGNTGYPHTATLALCGKLEQEFSQLPEGERLALASDYGLDELAPERVASCSYKLMELVTFYTANQNDVRAWAIHQGTHAPKAAGTVHTDMEKGFIKAEVIGLKRLLELGSLAKAKEKGEAALHGKDYVVQDGDVIFFRFNP